MAAPDWNTEFSSSDYSQGRVFVRAWDLFRSHWQVYIATAIVYMLLVIATYLIFKATLPAVSNLQVAQSGEGSSFEVSSTYHYDPWRSYLPMIAVFFLGLIPRTIIFLISIFSEYQSSSTALLSRSISLFLPLLAISLLTGLGIILGTILLIIPGIYLMIIWSVVIPVLIHNPAVGILGSLDESTMLTEYNRLNVLGTFVVIGLGSFVFMWSVQNLFGITSIEAFYMQQDLLPGSTKASVSLFLAVLLKGAYILWESILIVSVWKELRISKGQVDTQALEDVFA